MGQRGDGIAQAHDGQQRPGVHGGGPGVLEQGREPGQRGVVAEKACSPMNAVTCQVSALRHSATGARRAARSAASRRARPRRPHRARRAGAAGPGTVRKAQLRGPQRGGEQGGDGPQAHGQADRARAAARGLEHGHRDERGHDAPAEQGQQVQADQQACPAGAADQVGVSTLSRAYPAADDRAGETAGHRGPPRAAPGRAASVTRAAPSTCSAETAGQRRAGPGEHAEAEDRDRGQDGLPGPRGAGRRAAGEEWRQGAEELSRMSAEHAPLKIAGICSRRSCSTSVGFADKANDYVSPGACGAVDLVCADYVAVLATGHRAPLGVDRSRRSAC